MCFLWCLIASSCCVNLYCVYLLPTLLEVSDVPLDKIDPLVYPSKKMPVRRSSRLTARLEEAAQEEAVATTAWTCSSIWPTCGAKQRCSPNCWSSPWSFWTGGRRRRQRRQMVEGEDTKERSRREDQRQLCRAAKMQNQERPPTRSTTTLKDNHNRRDDNSSLHINTQGTGIPRETNWIGIRPLKSKDVTPGTKIVQLDREDTQRSTPRLKVTGCASRIIARMATQMKICEIKNNVLSMITRSSYQAMVRKTKGIEEKPSGHPNEIRTKYGTREWPCIGVNPMAKEIPWTNC